MSGNGMCRVDIAHHNSILSDICCHIRGKFRSRNKKQNLVKNSGATEMSVSPNGKEVAFVLRGEIFVTSIEGGTTKRITNTPQQERSVSFSSDGRSLVFAAERENIWAIHQISINRKEEAYFFNSTLLKFHKHWK